MSGTWRFLLLLLALATLGCGRKWPPDLSVLTRTDSLDLGDPSQPVRGVLVGAGDIAWCSSSADDSTGKLVRDIVGAYQARRVPVMVFTAGDNAYPQGRLSQYTKCYDPAWGGRMKGITRPAPGNHEYQTRNAAGYFGYFGGAAGPSDSGFYQYDLAGWDVYSLNSEPLQHPNDGNYRRIARAQETWLTERLNGPSSECSIAYWHHPRWNSGPYRNDERVDPLWKLLYQSGAEIVITGHEHLYERFKPLGADGTVDEAHGITEFVVGTGGADLRDFEPGLNAGISEKQINDQYGVLVLVLESDRAHWRFIATTGKTVDQGTVDCHGRPDSG